MKSPLRHPKNKTTKMVKMSTTNKMTGTKKASKIPTTSKHATMKKARLSRSTSSVCTKLTKNK